MATLLTLPPPQSPQAESQSTPSPSSLPSPMQNHSQRQRNPTPSPQPAVDVGYHHPPYPSLPYQPSLQSQSPIQSPQWTPSPNGSPYYPQYPSYFPPNPQLQHHPYYHPAQQQQQQQHQQQQQQQQQQLAQWAYQQMLFNAHQQQMASVDYQRQRSSSNNSHRSQPMTPPPDFYPPQPYPLSATGPPNSIPQGQNPSLYQGFHPYRRPGQSQSRQSSTRSQSEAFPTTSQVFSSPLVSTPDSAGSSSESSRGGGPFQRSNQPRTRTDSNNTSRSSDRSSPPRHSRSDSTSTGTGSVSRPPGSRSASVSSNSSTHKTPSPSPPFVSSSIPAPPTQPVGSTLRRPSKPSPLSQETSSASVDDKASRRVSRDDSELTYAASSINGVSTHVTRTGGLKGRLRRALALNSNATTGSSSDAGGSNTSRSAITKKTSENSAESSSPPHTPTSPSTPLPSSTSTRGRVKSKSLFNMKFNASTDNISLSSTVSSASVMIRKIGNMGKIARRSSIAGITRLFKDKDKRKKSTGDGASDDESNAFGSKASGSAASVSLATAELDKGAFGSEDWKGLSPAARLARQHTLKSKAAEDARATALVRQQKEREAPVQNDSNSLPVTWERGTARRAAQGQRPPIVTEGSHGVVLEEDDENGSDSEADDATLTRQSQWTREMEQVIGSASDDEFDDDGEEDLTVRVGSLDLQQNVAHGSVPEVWDEDASQWTVWREPPRDLKPVKGILRNAEHYDQTTFQESSASGLASASSIRGRANSYTGTTHGDHGPGPLARIPSPDPDHIDGLQKNEHHRTSSDQNNRLPDFSFELNSSPLIPDSETDSTNPGHTLERPMFNLPSMNSSAPVLSSMDKPNPVSLSNHGMPPRRITFAATLSIYDTFSATIYDRRCEPATCNRLTPALAQRIKEELNTYKMEEMEVHTASRIHTHFFV